MAWSREPGAQRDLPPNWWKLVAETKRLAGGRCQWRLPSGKRCPRDGTDADHIGNNEDHSQGNLRWLCSFHHKKRTSAQALAARVGPPKKVREEQHPGRLR